MKPLPKQASEQVQEFSAAATRVNLRRYLLDRVRYIMAFLLALLLSETALVLYMAGDGSGIDIAAAMYAALLAISCLIAWLIYDYVRQMAYYRELAEAAGQASLLEAALHVRSAVTADQHAAVELLALQHEAYMNEIGRYRREQEMHQHFVHQWVHQMKTPVSVIDLIAQQAEQTAEQGKTESSFASIREETRRMTQGLDLMLSQARLTKFELDVAVRGLKLEETIRQVVNRHKRLCIKHSIFPQIEGSAFVQTDEKWMTFVIQQLVTNAIKYSSPKSGTKRLVIKLSEAASGHQTMELSDEGIGIAAHELPRIFDPFYTGENGRLVGESTGMGLYLAKQVCLKLGHTIDVSSVPGEGTTFRLTFMNRTLHQVTTL